MSTTAMFEQNNSTPNITIYNTNTIYIESLPHISSSYIPVATHGVFRPPYLPSLDHVLIERRSQRARRPRPVRPFSLTTVPAPTREGAGLRRGGGGHGWRRRHRGLRRAARYGEDGAQVLGGGGPVAGRGAGTEAG